MRYTIVITATTTTNITTITTTSNHVTPCQNQSSHLQQAS
jgi:hypothetical protein